MSLGVCCQWLVPGKGYGGYVNTFGSRCLQYGRYKAGKYTDEFLREIYIGNAKALYEISKTVVKSVKCFRISSGLMPLADRVSRDLWDDPVVNSFLLKAGDVFRAAGCRITIHPGQFCVLSSDDPLIVEHAIEDLTIQGWLLDSMGMPRDQNTIINIHGGKNNRSKQLCHAIERLPDSVRTRLTLENDELSYSASDLHSVCMVMNVPLVLDSHHHTFNASGLHLETAIELANQTWPSGIKPLQHISNTAPEHMNGSLHLRRKHSDYIHYVPEAQLKIMRDDSVDVEIECKMKNIGVERLRKEFSITF